MEQNVDAYGQLAIVPKPQEEKLDFLMRQLLSYVVACCNDTVVILMAKIANQLEKKVKSAYPEKLFQDEKIWIMAAVVCMPDVLTHYQQVRIIQYILQNDACIGFYFGTYQIVFRRNQTSLCIGTNIPGRNFTLAFRIERDAFSRIKAELKKIRQYSSPYIH